MTETVATTTAAEPHKDNIFGICNALGEDFGFNPFYLRAALAVMLLVDAKLMLICYASAGVAVLASHLLVRPRRVRKPAPEAQRPWTPTIPDVRSDRADAVAASQRVLEPAI